MNDPRYNRQLLLPQIGETGQPRLAAARVLVVGCGALGSVIAEQLARAGVGYLRIVDRDIVELSNLQRQVLFDESDARDGLPKAVAAERRLRAINSQITIDAHVIDVHSGNIEELVGIPDAPMHLLLDGTDNVATRYLLNDAAVKHGIPWVYGACIGTEGRIMSIRPGMTACLRCVFPHPSAPGELQTCDTAGVLGPVASIVGSLEAIAAIRSLISPGDAGELIRLDGWTSQFTRIDTRESRRSDCPTCFRRQFEFLEAQPNGSTELCGRNAVQVRPDGRDPQISLDQAVDRLKRVAAVNRNAYFVRAQLLDDSSIQLTVFPDGRAIVHGTSDPARARSIYARFVGS